MEEEGIPRTSRRRQTAVRHSPPDNTVLECGQRSPGWCPFGNGCSPLLYSEEDYMYDWGDPENTTYGDRSTQEQVMLTDPSSSPYRSYQHLTNRLTSTPGRCHFSSSSSEYEESEITYTSQTVLLHISSSSSSSGAANPIDYSPADGTENRGLDGGIFEDKTSNSKTECESIYNSQSADNLRTTWKRIPSYHQVYADGSNLTYEYANISKDVIRAVQNIRVPTETKQWAVEYLDQLDSCRPSPQKRKKLT